MNYNLFFIFNGSEQQAVSEETGCLNTSNHFLWKKREGS